MTKRFLSIGECLIELVRSEIGDFRQGFAGDSYATARAARQALGPGWKVAFLTALGTDEWSDRIVAHLAAEQVETDFIARLAGRNPGLRIVDTGPGGERRIAQWRDNSAARALADDTDALDAAIAASHAIFFSGATLSILAPDARGQLLSALGRAKARGTMVAFDSKLQPGLWPDRGALRAAIRAAARVATIALPAGPEEAQLFGEVGIDAVAARYLGDGCSEILIRDAGGPALLSWPGGQIWPPPRRGPANAAATDDAFSGAYLAARATGSAPEQALARAEAFIAAATPARGVMA